MTARARVEPPALEGAVAALVGDRAHHLSRVARVRVGERVTLFDGAGRERDAVVERAAGGEVSARFVGHARQGVARDAARVTLLQGVPKGDKLETIARQATELGVERLVPVWTSRSVPRERPDRAAARHQRLLRVIEEAARQCNRADLPELMPACDLAAALGAAARCAVKVVAWEGSARPLPSSSDPGGRGVAALVGPEGGLDPREVLLAEASGFVAVSLGPRILRTETVAPALLAVLSARWGDLSPGAAIGAADPSSR